MRLRYQRLLYISSFGIFIILAPILVLYTAGYRYDFKQQALKKTGVLIVETVPEKATVKLDGTVRGTTPLRLTQLLPGPIEVTITKDGYHPITQITRIESNQTTFITDKKLFPATLPILVREASSTDSAFSVSPSGSWIVQHIDSPTHKTVEAYHVDSETIYPIMSLPRTTIDTLQLMEWSASGEQILIKQKVGSFTAYVIFDTVKRETIELLNITRLNFDQLTWHHASSDILYGLRDTTLYSINLATKSAVPVVAGPIQQFRSYRNGLLYTTTQDAQTMVHWRAVHNPLDDKKIALQLPGSDQYTIQVAQQDVIALTNTKTGQTFLISDSTLRTENAGQPTVLQTEAGNIQWSPNGTTAVLWTDFELSWYNAQHHMLKLITRFSAPIRFVSWHPNGRYIIYTVGTSIHAIEALAEKTNLDTTLAQFDSIANVWVDARGRQMFIAGSLGKQRGLFTIPLE